MRDVQRPVADDQGERQADARSTSAPPRWRIWFNTARPVTLTAAVSPVLVGTAVAAWQGAFHLGLFALTLVAGMLLQAGVNYLKEYCSQLGTRVCRVSTSTSTPLVSGFAWI